MSESDIELVRASSLFDDEFYRAAYPDVIGEGLDPAEHYVLYGGRESRDPGPEFSSQAYLDRNPDVARSGVNPLVHYLRVGAREGRAMNPLAEDVVLVRQSGFFDEEYYRHFRPTLEADVDAVLHYVNHGVEEDLDPSEAFSTAAYLRRNPDLVLTGMNPLVHFLRQGRDEGRPAYPGRPRRPEFDALYAERWRQLAPLPVASLSQPPGAGPRVTVLTDSVAASSLFGAVGTALILGTLLANRLGAALRVATRTDEPDAGVVRQVLESNGVTLDGPLEVAHVPLDGTRVLICAPDDVVVTTAWWITRAVLGSDLPRDQVVWLVQDDERMFYPFDDERLLCAETFDEPGLTKVVNTARLLAHLVADDDLPHFRDGLSFEPAFPGRSARNLGERAGGRQNFFFYSRPVNVRNLFWRGGLALSRAIEEGVLSGEDWEFWFVGPHTPDLTLPGGVVPHVVEGLSWQDYLALTSTMDAALVLMDTPHPSYPPYDLAASGAAVLTNSHRGTKRDLSDISANILVAEPTVAGLVAGLADVAALARDPERRALNVQQDHICRDWHEALEPVTTAVVQRLPERFRQG